MEFNSNVFFLSGAVMIIFKWCSLKDVTLAASYYRSLSNDVPFHTSLRLLPTTAFICSLRKPCSSWCSPTDVTLAAPYYRLLSKDALLSQAVPSDSLVDVMVLS